MGNERLLLGIIGVFGFFGFSFFVAGGFSDSVGRGGPRRGFRKYLTLNPYTLSEDISKWHFPAQCVVWTALPMSGRLWICLRKIGRQKAGYGMVEDGFTKFQALNFGISGLEISEGFSF